MAQTKEQYDALQRALLAGQFRDFATAKSRKRSKKPVRNKIPYALKANVKRIDDLIIETIKPSKILGASVVSQKIKAEFGEILTRKERKQIQRDDAARAKLKPPLDQLVSLHSYHDKMEVNINV